ncbi:MAG: hypothetical protein LBV60_18310 [Streptomyces sp.]|nr:hypothetical protein [Streptomyces sp.]
MPASTQRCVRDRWDGVLQARRPGRHEIAAWIRTAALPAGSSLIVLRVGSAGAIADGALKSLSDTPPLSPEEPSSSCITRTAISPAPYTERHHRR